MSQSRTRHISLLLLSALIGCTDTGKGPLDPQARPPFVSALTLSPDSVNVDALTPSGGTYTISSQIRATITDPDGQTDISTASFRVYRGTSLIQSGTLTRPASDTGAFAGQVSFTATRTQIGTYWVEVQPEDRQGSPGNTVRRRLPVAMKNVAPEIFRIGIPFSAAGDSVRLQPSAVLSDSNGYSDISSVSVRFRNSSDSSWKPMSDNGLGADASAGDGIFSAAATVKPLFGTENIVCEVRASDRSGLQGTLSRAVANRAPVIVRLFVPASISRPDAGTVNYTFSLLASDPDGLSDIDSVYFRNLSSASPTNFFMFDDGNIAANGDSVAGDGRFSRVISIDPGTSTGPRTFLFRVTDFAKATADSTRIITIN